MTLNRRGHAVFLSRTGDVTTPLLFPMRSWYFLVTGLAGGSNCRHRQRRMKVLLVSIRSPVSCQAGIFIAARGYSTERVDPALIIAGKPVRIIRHRGKCGEIFAK